MGIFAVWREKFGFIRFLVNAQKTPWYPALFAALCVIAGTNNYTVYIPVLWVLAAFVLFSVFFTDDNKVFLTPLLMIFFALGSDTGPDAYIDSHGKMFSFMDEKAFPWVIAICAICVSAFVIRLILDSSVATAFKKRRIFTWSIVAMDVAFLTNGLFSSSYDIKNLGFGAFFAMGFTVVYFLVSGMIEKSDDPLTYACYAMLGTACVALLQITTVVWEAHEAGRYLVLNSLGEVIRINKDYLSLGWGVSTVVAAVFSLGIPAAMYLAKNRRGSLFTFFLAPIFILGTIMVNCRAAMLVSIFIFVLCVIACCIKGKNRVKIRIYTAILALFITSVLVYLHVKVMPLNELIGNFAEALRLGLPGEISGTGREELWANGVSDFISSPIFGVGFKDGGYLDDMRQNVYSTMYHCIIVQIPAAMGIVGCIAFVLHILHLCKLFIKKISLDKTLLMTVPLMIIGMSLVDNFFFYLHFQIFYGAFLAVAEKALALDSGMKTDQTNLAQKEK